MNITLCSENKETTAKRILKFPCEYFGCSCDAEGAITASNASRNNNNNNNNNNNYYYYYYYIWEK
jgi:hypothetical protein